MPYGASDADVYRAYLTNRFTDNYTEDIVICVLKQLTDRTGKHTVVFFLYCLFQKGNTDI